MSIIEVKVPLLPESIADATVSKWYKKPGDVVKRDENIVDLETDKVMLEVPAPADGVLEKILKPEGSTVAANEIIAVIQPGNSTQAKPQPVESASTVTASKANAGACLSI